MSFFPRYSKKQWLILVLISTANLVNAFCSSIQSPFYPSEAESKGASPSQYGFVFGVYSLTLFMMAPLHGWLIPLVGTKLTVIVGMFIVTCTAFMFGYVDKINDLYTFLSYSFIIRIFEGIGTSGFRSGSLCIIISEFSSDVGLAFSVFQMSYGMGLTIGPTVGGVLYEIGGFTFPFQIISLFLLITTVLLMATIPDSDKVKVNKNSRSLFHIFKSPRMLLAMASVFGGFLIIGTLQPLLEPHLRTFNLSAMQIGFFYIAPGGCYALSTFFWGKLCDTWGSPHYIWCIGCVIEMVSLSLLGPAPYLPIQFTQSTAVVAMSITGIGYGAELIPGFYCFNQVAVHEGYEIDLNTNGFISALYGVLSSLGIFSGSSSGGVLYDWIGFSWGLQMLVLYQLLLLIFTLSYHICFWKSPVSGEELKQPLINKT